MEEAINNASEALLNYGVRVKTNFWQSIDISNKPDMDTYEVMGYTLQAKMPSTIPEAIATIKPSMPWAEDHFLERVGGEPINPGEQWKHWPYGNSASRFLRDGKFSNNYMERYWPKVAGGHTNHGIRFDYGDLNDVVELLKRDPHTRQAYLPVWFPEDTGVVHGERVPCTLGYHFMVRNDQLHCFYFIRSCDFIRHFRDDIYLTVRLSQWISQQIGVGMGELIMHISSLHCFVNDMISLRRAK